MKTFNYASLANKAWSSDVVALIAQVHEYKGRQEMFLAQKPAALDKLTEIAKIQSTEASNKIEGIVTTDARIRQLCEEKVAPKTRDEEEISGYRDALKTIHENYEYISVTSGYILQLHKILYGYSAKSIGGRFKNVQNYISEIRSDGTAVTRFTPLAPYETPGAIDDLCENYNKAIDSGAVDPLILIPTFISDFLCIHPFNDGNGRMSRLLTTLLLYRSGYVVGRYVSLESKIEKTKETYYDVLKDVSAGWYEDDNDNTPFIKYLLGVVLSAYRDFESRISLVDSKLSSIELVRNAVNKQIGKFTKRGIMELCPSLEKSSVGASLKALVEFGEISMQGSGKNTFYVRKN